MFEEIYDIFVLFSYQPVKYGIINVEVPPWHLFGQKEGNSNFSIDVLTFLYDKKEGNISAMFAK